MIKIESVQVVGLEPAIRGMRNPKNSWGKSDSGTRCKIDNGPCNFLCESYGNCNSSDDTEYCIGNNDLDLMTRLAKGGPVHAKYRRMIVVYLDITAPLYWWKEFDTYKVGTVSNSCSTMHKIQDKEFTLDDFSCEYLVPANLKLLEQIIENLNDARNEFNNWDNSHFRIENDSQVVDKKVIWEQMIQLLPSSYNQKRTIMLNYEVLVGIYKWRHNHKLDEWVEFCKWIEKLPYSEIITGSEKGLICNE